jgi:hypothetical protein
MYNIEELKSCYEDLYAWERHQDELERISGEDRQIDEFFEENL